MYFFESIMDITKTITDGLFDDISFGIHYISEEIAFRLDSLLDALFRKKRKKD